jgi:uncharacterized protein YbjT (DUF2867 family)
VGRRILVTGATGNVGRHVVSGLAPTGALVRALTRGSAGVPGGETVRGDLTEPGTLEACLAGVDAVFLVWPLPGADAAPEVLKAIARHTQRVVYLSSMSVRDAHAERADTISGLHAAIERLIEESGMEWTFLRAGGFATNTLGWAPAIRAEGVVRAPYGGASRSLVDQRDIAAVAVRALTGDGHVGAKYELTGPAALTQAEQARVIGEAIGRAVRFEEISREDARRQMIASGWPQAYADGALDAWAAMVEEPERVTRTVEEITGVPARTFARWAADHADAFGGPGS